MPLSDDQQAEIEAQRGGAERRLCVPSRREWNSICTLRIRCWIMGLCV